jgi:hypothetical protein
VPHSSYFIRAPFLQLRTPIPVKMRKDEFEDT